jgi:hypothetical protein
MRTQTKCTWSLTGLLIIEILPIPFTAIYSLFVIRKRPEWLPEVVERLYSDREYKDGIVPEVPIKEGHDSTVTRRRCTIALSVMFLIDVIVPFTVPFGFYVVRRRPVWFRNVVARLYSGYQPEEESSENQGTSGAVEPVEIDSVYHEILEEKHMELQQRNIDFARSIGVKTK